MIKRKGYKGEWVYTQKPIGYSNKKDFGDCVYFEKYGEIDFTKWHYDHNKEVEMENLMWENVYKSREYHKQTGNKINNP